MCISTIFSIINHTLHSTIRAIISTPTCTSMASNSTSDSECYFAIQECKSTVAILIVRGLKCVIIIEFALDYSRGTNYRVRVQSQL